MNARYFEDYPPGAVFTAGAMAVSEAEIIDFARKYDPQAMHTDPEAASRGQFGGLIASGWHTAAIFMRLLVDSLLSSTASMGSPGIDELRWLQPVRPGDTLRARFTVVEATPSTRRPDRGTVRSTCEMINQRGEVVMRVTGINIIGRRPT